MRTTLVLLVALCLGCGEADPETPAASTAPVELDTAQDEPAFSARTAVPEIGSGLGIEELYGRWEVHSAIHNPAKHFCAVRSARWSMEHADEVTRSYVQELTNEVPQRRGRRFRSDVDAVHRQQSGTWVEFREKDFTFLYVDGGEEITRRYLYVTTSSGEHCGGCDAKLCGETFQATTKLKFPGPFIHDTVPLDEDGNPRATVARWRWIDENTLLTESWDLKREIALVWRRVGAETPIDLKARGFGLDLATLDANVKAEIWKVSGLRSTSTPAAATSDGDGDDDPIVGCKEGGRTVFRHRSECRSR